MKNHHRNNHNHNHHNNMNNSNDSYNTELEDSDETDFNSLGLPPEAEFPIAVMGSQIHKFNRSQLMELFMHVFISKQLMKQKYEEIFEEHDIQLKDTGGPYPQVSYLSGIVEDFYKQLLEEKLKKKKEIYKQANKAAKAKFANKKST